jgi:hypothetical protein
MKVKIMNIIITTITLLSLKINKIKIIFKKINFNSRYQSKNLPYNKRKNINNIAKTANKLKIK